MQEVLDGDDTPLKDHHGQQIARDIVQFVPFREVMEKNGPNGCVVWLRRVPYRAKYTHCIYVFGHLSKKKFYYAVDRIGRLMHNPSPWSSGPLLSI